MGSSMAPWRDVLAEALRQPGFDEHIAVGRP
jgi:hypothetical protein